MFESVSPDEIDFLRLMLKCDANLSQEQKHASTKLAKKDFTDYVEVNFFGVECLIIIILEYCQIKTNAFHYGDRSKKKKDRCRPCGIPKPIELFGQDPHQIRGG